MADRNRPRYAVLIDADNIPAKYASAILREIALLGEPALRRVYGDWSAPKLAPWTKQVHELGLVAHQDTANTVGKNASDIGLVIDAMDILHAGRFDGFVLVSSDSDFTALANRIREQGLDVIGIGEEKAPKSLRKVCNRFILIENIVGGDGMGPAPDGARDKPVGSAVPNKQPPTKAVPLILEAMKKIDPDQDDYSLGQLGQVMTQLNPDFDPRTYGSAKLSELLNKTGRFEVFQGQNNAMKVRDKA